MSMQYCANCGSPSVLGERFCGECGSDLSLPTSTSSAPPVSPMSVTVPTLLSQASSNGFSPPPPPPTHQQGYGNTSPAPRAASRLSVVIGVVVIVALLGLGGYFLFLNKSGNSNVANRANPNPTATPNIALVLPSPTFVLVPATPIADGPPTSDATPNDPKLKAAVDDAVAAMQALDSYHTKISGRYNGTALQLEGDFSKSASQFTLTYAGRSYNAVFINDKQYISSDAGKSWQLDNSLDSIQSLTSLFDNPALGRNGKLTDLGQETLLNGQLAQKIQSDDPASGEQDTLWIVAYGEGSAIARLIGVNKTEGSKYDLTLDYSDFNKTLNITAPTPN